MMKKLHFIRNHTYEFDCAQLYGMDIFEQLVDALERQFDGSELLEISCKIEQERLYPARFCIGFNPNKIINFELIYKFFDQISARVDVNLDYTLIEQFLRQDFNYSNHRGFMIGVDLRRELTSSSIDFALTIKNYPEKQEAAIALINDSALEIDARQLLFGNALHINFDLAFNGVSGIELYPLIEQKDWQRADVQRRLEEVLSPSTLQHLSIPSCSTIAVGLSKANTARKMYYYLDDINDFMSYFPVKDIARGVHAYYQQQPVRRMCVALLENELHAKAIERMNLYYYL